MTEQTPLRNNLPQNNHLLQNKYFQLVVISSSVFALDQLTKNWIRETIHETGPIHVIRGFFRLVHVENPGAAWGILSDASFRMPFFYTSTLVALVGIGIFFHRLGDAHKALRLALAVVLGGALGNFYDRIVYQSVTDFLDFFVAAKPVSGWLIRTFGTNRWPSFNIADIAIVVGLSLLMYDSLILEPRRVQQDEKSGGEDGPERQTSVTSARSDEFSAPVQAVTDGGA